MAQGASEASIIRPTREKGRLRLLGEVLALAVIYLVTARLGLWMAHPGTNATAVWLPTGIAIAAVLRWGPKVWPGIFLGSLGVNAWLLLGLGLSFPGALLAAFAAAAGNSTEAVLAGFLIARFTGTRNPFGRSRDVVSFIFVATLLSTSLSALVGVSALCAATGKWDLFGASALTWWLGDATGALLVTPLVIALGPRTANAGAFRERMEFLLAASVTTGLWYVSFFRIPALMVLFIPWIAIVALRLSPFFSSAIVFLLAALATWGTLQGAAPFAAETLHQSLLLQQAFIGSIAVATLALTSTVHELEGNRLLRRKTNRYDRDLFERSTMGLALCTVEGRLVDINPAYAGLLGRTVEETLSLTYWDITPKDYAEQELAQLASLRETGRYGPYDKEYLRKDGTRIPVRLSGLLVRRGDENLIWSSAEDITEHKKAEARVLQLNRLYRTLSEVNQAIMRAPSRKALLQETCQILVEHGGFRMAWVGFKDEATGRVVAEGSAGFETGYLESAVIRWDDSPEGLGPTGRAIRENRAVVFQDCLNEPAFAPWRERALARGYRASAAFPVRQGDEVTGALMVYAAEPGAIGQENARLLEELAGDLGYSLAVLESARKKRQLEDGLRESDRRFRSTLENVSLFALTLSADSTIIFCNDYMLMSTGWRREDVLGKNWFEQFIPPDERDKVAAIFGAAIEKGEVPQHYENEILTRTGERRLIRWSNTILRDGKGAIAGAVSIGEDITELKRAEEETRRQSDLLARIMETSPVGIVSLGKEGRLVFANAYAERLLGLTKPNIEGRAYNGPEWHITELPGGKFPAERLPFRQVMATGRAVFDVRHAIEWPDGRRILLSINAGPLMEGTELSGVIATLEDITARVRDEAALRESEERSRLATELAHVAVWEYDVATDSMSRSKNHDALYGLEWQEKWDFQTFLQATHPEDREFSNEIIQRSVAPGGPDRYDFDFRVVYPDRSIRWLMVTGQVVKRDAQGQGALVRGCLIDITDRKRAEETLRQRSIQLTALNVLGARVASSLDLAARARAAVEEFFSAASPDLALLFLREGESLRLLDFAHREGGLSHEETPVHCVGQCLCGLAVKEGRALYSKDIHADGRCTWEECKKAGVRSFAALPLLAGDKIIGILGLASATERDFQAQSVFLETLAAQAATGIQNARLHEQIQRHAADLELRVEERTALLAEANHLLQAQMAERHKINAEIERLNEDLRRRAKELQVANRHLQSALDKSESAERAKSAFLAAMSHELRTPLNSVIGFTGVLLRGLAGSVSQEQREALEIVRRNGEHLLALINDVLDLSKIEAGEMRLALRPFELASVVRETVEALRPLADAKGLSLTLDAGEETLTLQGDRRRVAQILLNLLSNAVKFTQSGGIRVAVSRDEPRQEACVSVTDTGPGILESDLERIFREFEQLDGGTARVHEGTGLGLSLSRRLARMMGGDIRAESRRGAGSTFRCILPLRETLDGREANSRG